MRYKTYLVSRLKNIGIAIVGGVVSVLGICMLTLGTGGLLVLLAGVCIIGYAKYRWNEFHFEREENNHIFIKQGYFR